MKKYLFALLNLFMREPNMGTIMQEGIFITYQDYEIFDKKFVYLISFVFF